MPRTSESPNWPVLSLLALTIPCSRSAHSDKKRMKKQYVPLNVSVLGSGSARGGRGGNSAFKCDDSGP